MCVRMCMQDLQDLQDMDHCFHNLSRQKKERLVTSLAAREVIVQTTEATQQPSISVVPGHQSG